MSRTIYVYERKKGLKQQPTPNYKLYVTL